MIPCPLRLRLHLHHTRPPSAAHAGGPVPLFWPLDGGVSIPTGVLPSAGSLAFDNYYLWRNLLIEIGVLGPAFALLVAVFGRRGFRQLAGWTLFFLPAWAAFLTWSIALGR